MLLTQYFSGRSILVRETQFFFLAHIMSERRIQAKEWTLNDTEGLIMED
jgi:hypothetical protein